jgi:hypothetical protein
MVRGSGTAILGPALNAARSNTFTGSGDGARDRGSSKGSSSSPYRRPLRCTRTNSSTTGSGDGALSQSKITWPGNSGTTTPTQFEEDIMSWIFSCASHEIARSLDVPLIPQCSRPVHSPCSNSQFCPPGYSVVSTQQAVERRVSSRQRGVHLPHGTQPPTQLNNALALSTLNDDHTCYHWYVFSRVSPTPRHRFTTTVQQY